MVWTPPTASVCQSGGVQHDLRETSATEISTIGLDIAKQVFQIHGVDAWGRVVLRSKIVRARLIEFFSSQPRCLVTLEADGGRTTGDGIAKPADPDGGVHHVRPYVRRISEAPPPTGWPDPQGLSGTITEDIQMASLVLPKQHSRPNSAHTELIHRGKHH